MSYEDWINFNSISNRLDYQMTVPFGKMYNDFTRECISVEIKFLW